ncbi:hypothetical protein B0T17DRAFT_500130 [Bombardia bombarda]|uniref:Glucose-methanol-choline oxidoreductase N-terminal domain-containing protein n=1 Tax=Bombardia bombarda TaxID=252184 RepID=A0AA39U2Q6_9PEZI|nr:hypothetical protein B0T17DRAFT_500130 [Bombardia bombarda]
MVHLRDALLGPLLLLSFSVSSVVGSRRVPRYATVVQRQALGGNYSFIIAGGGIAGLTLADRLTEDPTVTVLVIEAGPFDQGQDGILVPGSYAPYLYFWPNLVTEPQTALNNRSIGTVCAQVVGGGSTINAMVFLRGKAEDYDGWGALGNGGWSWKKLLPYFIKSENFTRPSVAHAQEANITWDDSVRGNSGPVQYSYPNFNFVGAGNWWNAAKAVGLPAIQDPNAGTTPGVFAIPSVLDARTNTRSYARRNHYDRVSAARPNYHILASNTVSKVLFDGKQAIGVQYLPTAGGSVSTVYAAKEVIIAGGALSTPKVLQLSGVGPKKLLQKFNIPVVADLPGVGQNLQDQSTLTVPYTFSNNISPNSDSMFTNATFNAEQRALYDAGLPSAYTIVSTLGTNIALLSLKDTTPEYKQIAAQARARNPADSLPADVDPAVLAGYAAQRALILKQFESPNIGVGTLHWGTGNDALIYHLRPLSRGYVNIASTDPLANPILDYRTATDPADFQLYAALFRKNRALFASPTMQALGPTEASPFGANLTTDEDIINVMRGQVNPSNAHQCCTAAMLPKGLGGVVDSDHNVYGIKGLRVADISFWPMEVSAAPTATMYAAGERVSSLHNAQSFLGVNFFRID